MTMRHSTVVSVAALALLLVAGVAGAYGQATFKINFRFNAGGKKFAAGDYRVDRQADGQVVLKQEATGKEVPIAVLKTLDQPTPPVGEPRLVFDVVGNFEPSYTEYVTEYVLAEVWLPGKGGLLLHVTKGAHQNQTIKGQAAK
jgi:hypothetical protein